MITANEISYQSSIQANFLHKGRVICS